MVMSISFLSILKNSYGVAWPVLIALTINTLVTMVSSFYSGCLMGIEAFDAEGKIPMRQFTKTKIFKVFTLQYIQAAISLPLLYFILTQLPSNSVRSALYVITVLIGVIITTFLGLYAFMHRSLKLHMAWISVGKYIFAALSWQPHYICFQPQQR